MTWLEILGRDLSYALRVLRRTPSFTAVAIACLALGIGANAAVFTVFNAVLLKPLPYRDPDRLLAVFKTSPQRRRLPIDIRPCRVSGLARAADVVDGPRGYQPWPPTITGVDSRSGSSGFAAPAI